MAGAAARKGRAVIGNPLRGATLGAAFALLASAGPATAQPPDPAQGASQSMAQTASSSATPVSASRSLDSAATAAPGSDPTADSVVARGKYLVDLADCASCHTRNGGARFAGGRYMGMPFGMLSTPNITPDKQWGIGKYTDDEFVRLFRHGINRVGDRIYPAMPYPWYATMRREDALAIKAYLFSIPPVPDRRPPNKIYFPFNFRPAIAIWDWLFVPSTVFHDKPEQSALVNRGEYIVNSFAHCSECHNGRTLLGNAAVALPLQGGVITHWATPNITNDKEQGIGRFTDDEVFRYLKTGADDVMGTVVGPMRETVDVSLSKMRDDDIRAIVAYLRTQDRSSRFSSYKRSAYAVASPPGSNTYFSFCVSCHGADGRGVKGVIPALDGNIMVTAYGPQNVINTIIGGVEAKGSFGVMPALGTGMTNQQIAEVANYVRQAWSNGAPPNADATLVADLRIYADEASGDLLNGLRPGGCPSLDQPELQRVLANSSNGVVEAMKEMTVATMLQTVDTVIGRVKREAPDLQQADIVNGLTTAYCPIVTADNRLVGDQKAWQLDNFSTRVYTQLTTKGAY